MTHMQISLDFHRLPIDAIQSHADAFHAEVMRLRTVRDFSSDDVPRELIERCIASAGCAPSGANQQPWRFVAIADPTIKKIIRDAAEAEEREFYDHHVTDAWREALAPLGTDADRPFLETAPWLIAVFYEAYGYAADGGKRNVTIRLIRPALRPDF
jgi:iodotyrosine deiodinase